MEIHVKKASGATEPLDLTKVRKAVLRTGASKDTVEKVMQEVPSFVYDGISTRDIYRRVCQALKKYSFYSEARFRLKEAMIKMGPSGFPFETYISQVLKHYGYKTKDGVILKGACANHEIDIIVEEGLSNTKRYLVECKYHNAFGIYTGLKEALYTYARLLDLKEAYEKGAGTSLDGAWLITNTKISREATKYGECKGLKLLGWRYPPGQGLERLIQEKNLFPLTILDYIDKDSFDKFAQAGIMLVKDLETFSVEKLSEITKMSQTKIEKIKGNLIKFQKPTYTGL